MRKRLAVIVAITLVMSLMSVSMSSAAVSKPGKVRLASITAAKANPKSGKATVTIKWKKVSGASNYQVFVKRIDGGWKLTKTVKGSASKTKVKAFVGKNSVRIRAVKKSGSDVAYGKYSGTKTIKVKCRRTIESYIKSHPSERKQVEKSARESDMTVTYRDNDVIYTYDLVKAVGEDINLSSAQKKEMKKLLKEALDEKVEFFSSLCDELEDEANVGGVRIIIRYKYRGSLLVKKVFSGQ